MAQRESSARLRGSLLHHRAHERGAGRELLTAAVDASDCATGLEGLEPRVLLAGASGAPAAVAPLPFVAVVASRPWANETNPTTTGQGQFLFVRTGALSAGLTVNYTVAGTAATDGSDYAPLTGQVTFAPGSARATVNVTPVDDALAEDTETVVVALAADPAYRLDPRPVYDAATVRVLDNSPTVLVVASRPIANETNPTTTGRGEFTFVRVGPLDRELTVSYTVAGTTATDGSDYTLLAGAVTFAKNSARATASVTPVADGLAEDTETVILTLSADPAYHLNPVAALDTATVRILDNAPTVLVVASRPVANEANPTTTGRGEFTFIRTGNVAGPLTVHYTIAGTAPSDGSDYAALPGTVSFAPGQARATASVIPVDDTIGEGTVTVAVTLAADPTYHLTPVVALQAATVRILDDFPTVVIAATKPLAFEALAGTDGGRGVFTVSRIGGPLGVPLTVNYTVGGTAATDGTKYVPLSGTVTIPAGAGSAPIAVDVVDDDVQEGLLTVTATLSADAAYHLSPAPAASRATVAIVDNDPVRNPAAVPVVSILPNRPATSASDPVADSCRVLTPQETAAVGAVAARGVYALPTGVKVTSGADGFTVYRADAPIDKPLTVTYSVSGSATAGVDYQTLSGTVTIPAGHRSALIPVSIINDDPNDPDESIILTLKPDRKYRVSAALPSGLSLILADPAGGAPTLSGTICLGLSHPLPPGVFGTLNTLVPSPGSLATPVQLSGGARLLLNSGGSVIVNTTLSQAIATGQTVFIGNTSAVIPPNQLALAGSNQSVTGGLAVLGQGLTLGAVTTFSGSTLSLGQATALTVQNPLPPAALPIPPIQIPFAGIDLSILQDPSATATPTFTTVTDSTVAGAVLQVDTSAATPAFTVVNGSVTDLGSGHYHLAPQIDLGGSTITFQPPAGGTIGTIFYPARPLGGRSMSVSAGTIHILPSAPPVGITFASGTTTLAMGAAGSSTSGGGITLGSGVTLDLGAPPVSGNELDIAASTGVASLGGAIPNLTLTDGAILSLPNPLPAAFQPIAPVIVGSGGLELRIIQPDSTLAAPVFTTTTTADSISTLQLAANSDGTPLITLTNCTLTDLGAGLYNILPVVAAPVTSTT